MPYEKKNRGSGVTALYCRLSKDDKNSSESMSIQSQKGMLKRYAEENGLLNTKFYIDDGYSGANFVEVR